MCNYITKGYTRLVYFDASDGTKISRLDYYLYSTNEAVAIVSDYGTITAISEGTSIIRAVLKADMSYVKDILITVWPDSSSTPYELALTTDQRYDSFYNGTMVQFSGVLENVVYVGYTRAICIVMQNAMGEDISPSSIIQHFTWSSSNPVIASVDGLGYIRGNSVGTTTITGTYNFNDKFFGNVEMTITVS